MKAYRRKHDEAVILLVEDDEGHAGLITKNLTRAGIVNKIVLFKDGQAILDFLFQEGDGPQRECGASYIVLLDIRLPKVDGVEVLERMKAESQLHKIPVIMLTTTDDSREMERCYELGCSNYIVKPVAHEDFVVAIRQLGLFLTVVQLPHVDDGETV